MQEQTTLIIPYDFEKFLEELQLLIDSLPVYQATFSSFRDRLENQQKINIKKKKLNANEKLLAPPTIEKKKNISNLYNIYKYR